ncbi:two component transcriptional regulator, LuxR family [Parafrankia sp. EAN1pec]|nr:two component transcriptional regulator, LuxR family [Frankia sp. EAN1pec]
MIRLATVLPVGDVIFLLLSVGVAAAALGFAVRIRRAQLAALRDRARQLEIERDQRSRLVAASERARMAREMHDIVGHSLAVIIALADGGAYAVDVAPERGKEALNLIGDTSRRSLGELRRILGVLRERAEAPDLSPQPRIADLDSLCRRVRAAGPQVEYQSAGELDALDLGVQLAAYRIVQEALTNILKHAGPRTRVRMALRIDGTRLRIMIRDKRLGFRMLLESNPDTEVAGGGRSRILILTTFDLDEYVHAALRAGASGFLLKDAYPEELLAGIRAVAVGDAVIAPALARRLLDAFAQHLGDALPDGERAADPRLDTLTEREREILVAIGHGWTNGEIAERLVLSESTVKTHVGRMLAKIGARDRVQAVICAYDLGLTRPQARTETARDHGTDNRQ